MPSRPSTPRPSRTSSVPAAEDLNQAKEDALLQLKIGRSAHLYTVGISAALAIDGVLLLFLFAHLPTVPSGATGLAALVPLLYLLVPVFAGLGLAATGLALKWDDFQLWPWEAHFSTTVGAVVYNVLLALLVFLRIAGVGFAASLSPTPWLLPAALGGITLALEGLALTWYPWDSRHGVAALAAGLPLLLVGITLVPVGRVGTGPDGVAVVLLLSAILYQTSGSFLHLVSSGTQAHERSLVSSSQSRIFRLAEEIRQKEAALRFRESAVVKREADAENAESSVRREQALFAETRGQIEKLDEDVRTRAEALAQRERAFAGRVAAVDGIAKQLESRSKAVELKEQEIGRQVPQFATREQRLGQREADLARREVDLGQRAADLDRRTASAGEVDARLDARRKEIDQKTAELLRREGDLTSKGPGPAGPARPASAPPADLAGRELKLQQLKAVLDEQNATLGRRSREIADREKAAEERLRKTMEAEAALAARQTTVGRREGELADHVKAADERRAQYEAAAREYENRLKEINRLQVEAAQRSTDLDRSKGSLDQRESTLTDREKRIRDGLAEIDRRERDLHEREAALDANEAEMSLRRQELDRAQDLPIAGLAAVAAADRVDRPATRRDRARAASQRPPGTPEDTRTEDILVPHTGRRYADRLPTGTPRLDDLLLGGLPPNGHVVLLGDAFVGKEVVLYSFLAEGLKRGEPVVLVTAARSPAEIAQSLGVVLPQFLEYEQMNMVHWIDASGTGAANGPHRVAVKGSDDRAGILSALVQTAKTVEDGKGGAFRVGFLGVSAMLAHSDERASFSFFNNVVGILKPRKALAMYSLEGGALSEAQVESLLGRMDGAIVFRQDRDRTFLSVKGFGDVQTREWVECRATNRSLIVGSFALERIR